MDLGPVNEEAKHDFNLAHQDYNKSAFSGNAGVQSYQDKEDDHDPDLKEYYNNKKLKSQGDDLI